MRVLTVTGKESSRSYVPARFSHGVINGPTDEATKKTNIAASPGKSV
jgi:hypothetical protein